MFWTLLIIVVLFAWAVWVYNRFVRLQQRAHQAWSDIDAQLKRRHDLVPSLVETVKGYAAHERGTLEEVISRRTVAARAAGTEGETPERVASETQLVLALRGLFALAEQYPDLKASDRFGKLHDQLAEIEDHLQNARRYFNAVVRDLNTALASFPDVVVGRLFGFQPREFFELDSPLERQAVAVELDTGAAADTG